MVHAQEPWFHRCVRLFLPPISALAAFDCPRGRFMAAFFGGVEPAVLADPDVSASTHDLNKSLKLVIISMSIRSSDFRTSLMAFERSTADLVVKLLNSFSAVSTELCNFLQAAMINFSILSKCWHVACATKIDSSIMVSIKKTRPAVICTCLYVYCIVKSVLRMSECV